MKNILNNYYSVEFSLARLICYTITFTLGFYVFFIDHRNYLCNTIEYKCPTCGMKTAIYHAIRFNFEKASNFNPYFYLIIATTLLLLIDVIVTILVLHKRRK